MAKKEEKPQASKEQKQINSELAKKLASQAKIMKYYGSCDSDKNGGIIASQESDDIAVYPTGIYDLDNKVFGVGGVPKGCITEIYGLESSGKSALAYFISAKIQEQNKTAIIKLYDAEKAFTNKWGRSMGLDLDRLVKPRFWGAENMADQYHADLASAYPPEVTIIDSLAVLQPEQIMEKNVSDFSMHDNMARATFLTRFFNSVRDGFWYPPKNKKGELSKDAKQIQLGLTPNALLCVNHVKAKTRQVMGKTFTDWITVGGVSLNFHATIRLFVKKIGYEKTDGKITHQILKVKADKNKIAPPLRECELRLSFAGGIEQVGVTDYLEMATNLGLASQKGGWIESALLPKGKIQGKDKFNEFVEGNKEVKKTIIGGSS